MENPAYDGSRRASSAVSGGGGGGAFLTVENDDDGATHTYVYEPDRSFQQMTLEALPQEENYEPGVRTCADL